jgi:hypothetical protein
MWRIIRIALLITLGCSSVSRYPNWEYVRIESAVPARECIYKVQEACPRPTALEGCSNWYKKRATKFEANTVVKTEGDLAEYYSCPERSDPSILSKP